MTQAAAHADRIFKESLKLHGTLKGNERHIFDLSGTEGHFETSSVGLPEGTRSFGIWTPLTPKKNDLIVIKRPHARVLYLITEVGDKPNFSGEDGNHFWHGRMNDVDRLNLWTPKIIEALEAAGL